MKLNRKTIIIGGFILFDCIFGGLVVSSKTLKQASANSVATIKTSANSVVVDNLVTVDDDVATIIEKEMVSQEDLLIAEDIIMNEQNNAQKEEAKVQEQQRQAEISKQKALEEQKAKEIARSNAIVASNKALEQKLLKEAQSKLADGTIASKGNAIAKYSLQFNGNPYVYGGTSLTKGADCSGFIQSLFKNFGINLPRVASAQARVGYEVALKDIMPGDLVFYSNGGNAVTHVALYIGDGKIIHARTPAHGIGINSMFIMKRLHIRRVIQ